MFNKIISITSSQLESITKPKLIVLSTADEVSKEAARRLADIIIKNNEKGKETSLGFATGGTMIDVYAELITISDDEGIDWSNVTTTVNLDEHFGLPAGHAEEYREFMMRNIFTHMIDNHGLKQSSINLPDSQSANPDSEMAKYTGMILSAEHKLDAWIVGIGIDGHVAFHKPAVEITADTIRDIKAMASMKVSEANNLNPSLLRAIRDNNEFVFMEDISTIEAQDIMEKIISIQNLCRVSLSQFEDLRLPQKEGKFVHSVDSEALKGELDLLGKRMLDKSKITFYFSSLDDSFESISSDIQNNAWGTNVIVQDASNFRDCYGKHVNPNLSTLIANSRYFQSVVDMPTSALSVGARLVKERSECVIQVITGKSKCAVCH